MSIGAIGEGVLSSYNMFQDMKQRRFNNDMARRQDARAQAQEGVYTLSLSLPLFFFLFVSCTH